MSSTREWIWAITVGGSWAALEWFLGTFWRKRKEARAQSWPLSYGRVTKAVVFSGKSDVALTISYTYPVPDEPYPIPADFEKEFYSRDEAQAWADALSDQNIPVRVNPSNSWKSMLLSSDLKSIVQASHPKSTDEMTR